LDLHIQAFRLAELVPGDGMPDGSFDSPYDRVDMPTQQVDAFLPRYQPRQSSIRRSGEHRRDGGARGVHRVRYLSHHKQLRALIVPQLATAFKKQFGRDSGDSPVYRTADAKQSSLRSARSTGRCRSRRRDASGAR
jgi:hypothetical protein